MTKFIIIRHCQTIDNVKGKLQGYHNDSDLTEEGLNQLNKLVKRFKNENIKAIFCSDLGRTLTTSKAIANSHGLKPIPVKELRECNIGDWDHLPVKEMLYKWTKFYDNEKQKGVKREYIRPPNGENSFDHRKRILRVINKIIKKYPKDTVIIVAHSGTNKVIMGIFEKKDPDDFYTIEQSNACINIIEINGKKSKIISINDVEHLKDERD
jgi:broad specificity phosphatase PhoE